MATRHNRFVIVTRTGNQTSIGFACFIHGDDGRGRARHAIYHRPSNASLARITYLGNNYTPNMATVNVDRDWLSVSQLYDDMKHYQGVMMYAAQYQRALNPSPLFQQTEG